MRPIPVFRTLALGVATLLGSAGCALSPAEPTPPSQPVDVVPAPTGAAEASAPLVNFELGPHRFTLPANDFVDGGGPDFQGSVTLALHWPSLELYPPGQPYASGLGRAYDANSERLAQSATALARQHGLERIDHVLLSIDTGRGVRAGEHLFVVQGRVDDPAHLRASMKTDEAMARTPTQNEAWLTEAREQQAQRAVTPPQEMIYAATRENAARALG